MKYLSLIIILIFSFSVFGQTKNLLNETEKFTPDAQYTIAKYSNSKVENGKLNGVAYQFYYSDASGKFVGRNGGSLDALKFDENWSVACKKDAIDDSKICYMNTGDLFIFVSSKDDIAVSIGSKNYPDSVSAIRINEGTAYITKADGVFTAKDSKNIVEDLKKATTVTTRYQKFPYKRNIDKTWEIYGFNEAFQYINWAIQRIK